MCVRSGGRLTFLFMAIGGEFFSPFLMLVVRECEEDIERGLEGCNVISHSMLKTWESVHGSVVL